MMTKARGVGRGLARCMPGSAAAPSCVIREEATPATPPRMCAPLGLSRRGGQVQCRYRVQQQAARACARARAQLSERDAGTGEPRVAAWHGTMRAERASGWDHGGVGRHGV